jgi:galactose mutarotase-like enzyme
MKIACQFIELDDHENSKKYIFTKESGFQVTLVSYGASILSILHPDKQSNVEEVTLNYSDIEDIKKNPGPYFGV